VGEGLPLDLIATVLALVAAVLHASWNAAIKVRGDRLMAMAMLCAGSALCGLPFALLADPIDPACFPYLAGTIAVHCLYYVFLLESYRVADLSHAYPLARGSAPLWVAMTAPLFLGENLTLYEAAGIGLVSAGILSLVHAGGGLFRNWRGVAFPLLTGVTIAVYSTFDARGVRVSDSPLGYIGWLFLLDGFPIVAYVLIRKPMALKAAWRENARIGVVGGFVSFLGYGLVVLAMSFSQATHVVALRETSVIIAAGIGAWMLGEPFGPRRILAAALVAAGAIVLKLG